MNKIKNNNKGFTLVELIVVIAVLAVITVVAAPQYLSYVEKSRVGTDKNALEEIAHAAEIAYIELQADELDTNDDSYYIEVTTTGDLAYATTGEALTDAVDDVMPAGSYTFKSDEYTDTKQKMFIVVNKKGNATVVETEPSAQPE